MLFSKKIGNCMCFFPMICQKYVTSCKEIIMPCKLHVLSMFKQGENK